MPDDKHFEAAFLELEEKSPKQGLLARCYAEENGDVAKSKAKYLRLRAAQLEQEELMSKDALKDNESLSLGSTPSNRLTEKEIKSRREDKSVDLYENPEAKELHAKVEVARTCLAELETTFTLDKSRVDGIRAKLFYLLRPYREERDRISLIVEYRKEFLASLQRGDNGESGRVKQAHREAQKDNEREYEKAAKAISDKRELTGDDEIELGVLWKSLVKLYHPDRFAREPEKLETYGKLTAAINRAKDTGDLSTLRLIANDPDGFVLKQGWASVDLSDEKQANRLEKLLESIEGEIKKVQEEHELLKRSSEFELYQLSTKNPQLLDTITEKQVKQLEAEISELTTIAAKLAEQIEELTDDPPPGQL